MIAPEARIPAGGAGEVVADASGVAPSHSDAHEQRQGPQIRYDPEEVEARRHDQQDRQRDGQPLQAPLGQEPGGALGPLQQKPELLGLDGPCDAAQGLKLISELDCRRQLPHGLLAPLYDLRRSGGQEPISEHVGSGARTPGPQEHVQRGVPEDVEVVRVGVLPRRVGAGVRELPPPSEPPVTRLERHLRQLTVPDLLAAHSRVPHHKRREAHDERNADRDEKCPSTRDGHICYDHAD